MLHSMHPIYGMLCPSAPFTFRSKSVIEQIVGLGVNESYRYSDMVVICEPLSIKAYVSVPLMVMVVSLECPTSLSKRLYDGLGLSWRFSSVCPSTRTPSRFPTASLLYWSPFDCYVPYFDSICLDYIFYHLAALLDSSMAVFVLAAPLIVYPSQIIFSLCY